MEPLGYNDAQSSSRKTERTVVIERRHCHCGGDPITSQAFNPGEKVACPPTRVLLEKCFSKGARGTVGTAVIL